MARLRNKIIVVFLSIGFMVSLINPLYAKQDDAKDFIERPYVEYKKEELRDPFRSPLDKEDVKKKTPVLKIEEKPLPALEIQGIVWGGFLPQAIINNKVVKVGDVIGEVKLIDINKDGITVFFDNREYNLSSPAVVNLQGLKRKPEGGEYEE